MIATEYNEFVRLTRDLSTKPHAHQSLLLGKGPKRSIIYDTIFDPNITKQSIDYLLNEFKTQENDVFVTSYPKCGTHFVLKLCFSVIKMANSLKLMHTNLHEYVTGDIAAVPELEVFASKHCASDANLMQKFRNRFQKEQFCFWWTHSKWTQMQRFHETHNNSKYIHIVRNPKDTMVSGYEFYQKFQKERGNAFDGDFGDWFSQFVSGYCPSGDYFEHFVDWYHAHLFSPHKKQILFLYYEELNSNDASVVALQIRKIVDFLGFDVQKFTPNDICQIIEDSTLSNMKNNLKAHDYVSWHKVLVRKGVNNDWKNYLNQSQSNVIDERIRMYFQGFDCIQSVLYNKQLNHSKL